MFYDGEIEDIVGSFYTDTIYSVDEDFTRSAPTHTEDGIPIRKLYVTNLPQKATRAQLFNLFGQYGNLKSCWMRMAEKRHNKGTVPSYAFVTYINPDDANKVLKESVNEIMLLGRRLKIYPADSWHQPVEDQDGTVRWKKLKCTVQNQNVTPTEIQEVVPEIHTQPNIEEQTNIDSEVQISNCDDESCYSIIDVLNRDCLIHICTYVPIRDLIRSERVSKSWQNLVQDYISGLRSFRTSSWQHDNLILTTAVLRHLLQRLGPYLLKLYIDDRGSCLNDRTAQVIGKFCPNLEELTIIDMNTKNWNPLIYGCKHLKTLSFIECNKLTDANLVQLVRNDSKIESITVAGNSHVTGLFLTGGKPHRIKSLVFHKCYSVQGTVLKAATESLPNLTVLNLDSCPLSVWKVIPLILQKVTKLEELSLSGYSSVESTVSPRGDKDFCDSFVNLTELKTLNLSKNIYITDNVLKQVAKYCPNLQSFDVSSCNSRRSFPHKGVSDNGIVTVCRACTQLSRLNVSYLAALTDTGISAIAVCTNLKVLIARGNPEISAAPFAVTLASCHNLQEVDVCGCDMLSEEIVPAAMKALEAKPRPLMLRLAGTLGAFSQMVIEPHKFLTVDTDEDRCDPHLRPDFVDRLYNGSSDESLDDFYDNDDYDFYNSDQDYDLGEGYDQYDDFDGPYLAVGAYGIHGGDFLLF